MDEVEEQIEEGATRKTMATGGPICPICKGSGSCPPCSSTGLARHPDGKAFYCPRCWGFGCCLHCRGQGFILPSAQSEPCMICGTSLGNHQNCKIAAWIMDGLGLLVKNQVQPDPTNWKFRVKGPVGNIETCQHCGIDHLRQG